MLGGDDLLDKEYLLEQLTENNVVSIIQKLGGHLHRTSKTKSELQFNTICHGGSSHKLYYYGDTKTFFCYTNCGFMDIFSLVAKVQNCGYVQSLEYVAQELGIDSRKGFSLRSVNYNARRELAEINKYIEVRSKKLKQINHLPLIETDILNYFESDVFYQGWIDEGISIETMKVFGILWYELEKHIVIPHRNIKGELIGIRRRSLQDKDQNNKYMPETIEGVTYNHSLNINLYGLYEHLQGIKKFKKVVLVEGEKSVLLAHEFYGDDAFVVATCGFNISNWHRDILLELGVNEVMIAFDRDYDPLDFIDFSDDSDDSEYKKYKNYENRILSLAYKLTPYFRTYVIWDEFRLLEKKDSPFDKGQEILELLMKNKIEITTNNHKE